MSAIILIDDEVSVRLPLRLSLERSGYRVFEAGSGEEGLELIARHGQEIGLVVVDHRMPDMWGTDVIHELHRRAVRTPAVLMSGLSSGDVELRAAKPDAFLRKPFELVELVRTVRSLIDQSGRAAS